MKNNKHTNITTLKDQKRNKLKWAFIMLAPLMLGIVIFYIIPFFQNFFYSFTDHSSFGNWSFVGLDNYKALFEDAVLGRSFVNTFIYTIFTAPISIFIAILIAVLLNQDIKGKTFYRVMYFLPAVTMPAAIGMIWRWIYNGHYGILNQFLSKFGIENINWVTDPKYSIFALIIVGIWMSIAMKVIFFLGGLQTIPQAYYEASKIDGAGPIRQFFHITLPLLSPTIFFVSITTLIESIQLFDLIYLLVPRNSRGIESTRTVVHQFYTHAFEYMNKGYASAISILLFVVILLITAIQFYVQKKWVHYD